MSKTELRDQLVRHDTKKSLDKFETQQTEHKILRLGSGAGSALLTGAVYQKWPSLEALMGTPASVDHLLAVGGAVGAFVAEDEEVAAASEGIATMAISHLLRNMGRKVAGAVT